MSESEGPVAIQVRHTEESQEAHASLAKIGFPFPDFIRAMLIAKARDVASGECSAANLLAPPSGSHP